MAAWGKRSAAVLEPREGLYPSVGMPTQRSNDDWLRELRAGGAEQALALEALRRYLHHALPGCLKRYGAVPEHLVEDVVQDALVRALDQLDGFEGRSRFTTWVTSIAVRGALTELRRKRWQDVSLAELTEGTEVTPQNLANGEVDPERQASQLGIIRAMYRILESELSERQRTAVIAELQGMPQEEIGRRLGTTRNAVYKLGHDARRKLKLGLEASGFDAEEIRAAFQ